MAQLHIILRRDPATGRQNLVIKLDSDADALPQEHEQLHRQLVEKLIDRGIAAESLGELIIERDDQLKHDAQVGQSGTRPQRSANQAANPS